MKVLGVLALILAVMALTIPPALMLQEFQGHGLSRLEQFISKYDGIIISLGTAIMISVLGVAATIMANNGASQREKLAGEASDQREKLANVANELREKMNRQVSAELKIAEFRQIWINDMRDDLASYAAQTLHKKHPASFEETAGLRAKIIMRLNKTEPLAGKLLDAMSLTLAEQEGEAQIRFLSHMDLEEIASDFLRNEWKRLKTDIKNAQVLQGISPEPDNVS